MNPQQHDHDHHDHDHDHDHDHHAPDEGMSDEDKAEADMRRRRVRLGMVLTEVGRTNNLQVTDEEKNRAVFQEAQRYPGQEQQVLDTSSRTRKPPSNWPDRSLKTK